MGSRAADPEEVRKYAIAVVSEGQRNLARLIQARFGVSRPTAHNYIRKLVDDAVLVRTGVGAYALAHRQHRVILRREGLHEDEVWVSEIRPMLDGLPDNVRRIWEYGCTEMINNAIDHSESDIVAVDIDRTAGHTKIEVDDFGVGIFRKIANALGLEDDRHAVLELTKGKVTTDPENHSGEGIFFSSRAMDEYTILSGGVFFTHDRRDHEDWILGEEVPSLENISGTHVSMRLANDTERTLSEVFDQYATDKEDYGFDKTVVPVRLLQYGDDHLVSRSQAKRLLSRFDRFRIVILNFENVDAIGQAFADEVFRVFRSQHPEVEVIPINANEQVTRMINRVTQHLRGPDEPGAAP